MFPGLGERIVETGNDKKILSQQSPFNRDSMAAENMGNVLVYVSNGSRPEYLSSQVL
jgi:hypothetical protein